MAITSHAFGQVRLTDQDAEKFYNQVTFGKPKAEAVEAVKAGSDLFRSFQQGGSVKVTGKAKAPR